LIDGNWNRKTVESGVTSEIDLAIGSNRIAVSRSAIGSASGRVFG